MENGYSASDKEDLDTLFAERTKTFRNERTRSFDTLGHARIHLLGHGSNSCVRFMGYSLTPVGVSVWVRKKQREKTTTYANKKARSLTVSGLFGTP